MKRAAIAVVALVLWLVLAVLWVAWSVLVVVLVQRRRWRRMLIPDFPNLARMAGWPPTPERRSGPRRMTASQKARRLAQLVARDGLWCQECGLELRLDVHHDEDDHPEVHHLVAWSLCRGEWWADELVNLVLLDGPCNREIGTGITPTLRRKQEALLALYGLEAA